MLKIRLFSCLAKIGDCTAIKKAAKNAKQLITNLLFIISPVVLVVLVLISKTNIGRYICIYKVYLLNMIK